MHSAYPWSAVRSFLFVSSLTFAASEIRRADSRPLPASLSIVAAPRSAAYQTPWV